MKVIVIGCGKFGVKVAEYLTRQNHEVTVIDHNKETFHLFSEDFTGKLVCGFAYDRAVLEEAGITMADVLISCASSDSINAVVANLAKNIYHVPTVIARMYDPIRAKMFESMGIYTVSITRLGVENIMEYLEDHRNWRVIYKLGDGDIQIVKARVSAGLEGKKLSELNIEGKMNLIGLERKGHPIFPEKEMVCEYHDMLYLAIHKDYTLQARKLLQL